MAWNIQTKVQNIVVHSNAQHSATNKWKRGPYLSPRNCRISTRLTCHNYIGLKKSFIITNIRDPQLVNRKIIHSLILSRGNMSRGKMPPTHLVYFWCALSKGEHGQLRRAWRRAQKSASWNKGGLASMAMPLFKKENGCPRFLIFSSD